MLTHGHLGVEESHTNPGFIPREKSLEAMFSCTCLEGYGDPSFLLFDLRTEYLYRRVITIMGDGNMVAVDDRAQTVK